MGDDYDIAYLTFEFGNMTNNSRGKPTILQYAPRMLFDHPCLYDSVTPNFHRRKSDLHER